MSKVMKGFKDGFTLGIAYFPFAFTFGLMAANYGFGFIKAFLMSATIYAGSSQVIIINMASKNALIFQIVLAAVIVNIRYALITIPIINKQKQYGLGIRILSSLLLTDESISYLTINKIYNAYETFGFGFSSYLCFLLASMVGALANTLIPLSFTNSLKFILYAVFVYLLSQVLMSNYKYYFVIVTTLVIKLLLNFAGLSPHLSLILAIILGALIPVLVKGAD